MHALSVSSHQYAEFDGEDDGGTPAMWCLGALLDACEVIIIGSKNIFSVSPFASRAPARVSDLPAMIGKRSSPGVPGGQSIQLQQECAYVTGMQSQSRSNSAQNVLNVHRTGYRQARNELEPKVKLTLHEKVTPLRSPVSRGVFRAASYPSGVFKPVTPTLHLSTNNRYPDSESYHLRG